MLNLYSTDLAPSNYWLFPKPKLSLNEKRFKTVDKFEENVMKKLITITKYDFLEWFKKSEV